MLDRPQTVKPLEKYLRYFSRYYTYEELTTILKLIRKFTMSQSTVNVLDIVQDLQDTTYIIHRRTDLTDSETITVIS